MPPSVTEIGDEDGVFLPHSVVVLMKWIRWPLRMLHIQQQRLGMWTLRMLPLQQQRLGMRGGVLLPYGVMRIGGKLVGFGAETRSRKQ